jgi:hypothetical protein
MDFLLAVLWLLIAGCGFAQGNGVGIAVGSAAGAMAGFRAARWWFRPPARITETKPGPAPPVVRPEFDFTNPEPGAVNPTP